MENYLYFMKNCIRPPYEKLKPLKSGFIENSNFEKNRDPCPLFDDQLEVWTLIIQKSMVIPPSLMVLLTL